MASSPGAFLAGKDAAAQHEVHFTQHGDGSQKNSFFPSPPRLFRRL